MTRARAASLRPDRDRRGAGSLQASGRALFSADMELWLAGRKSSGSFEVGAGLCHIRVRSTGAPLGDLPGRAPISGSSFSPFRLTVAGARADSWPPGEEAYEVTPAALPACRRSPGRDGNSRGARFWTVCARLAHVAVDGTVDGNRLAAGSGPLAGGLAARVRPGLRVRTSFRARLRDATVGSGQPGAELLWRPISALAGAEVASSRMARPEGVDGFVEIRRAGLWRSRSTKAGVVAPEGGIDLAGARHGYPGRPSIVRPVEFRLRRGGADPAPRRLLASHQFAADERAGL